MGDKKWCPHNEAKCHLDRYKYFFRFNRVTGNFDHPQEVEDYLQDICHQKWCYTWAHESGDRIARSRGYYELIGIQEKDVAMLLILTFSFKLLTMDKYRIFRVNTGGWRIEFND